MTPADALTLHKHEPLSLEWPHVLGYVVSVADDGSTVTARGKAWPCGTEWVRTFGADQVKRDGPAYAVPLAPRADSPWIKAVAK